MDLELEDFDIERLHYKGASLILGDSGTGRTTLIKNIITTQNLPFISGIICTDSKHSSSFYPQFLHEMCIYKRYSALLASRCYQDNSYLVLDDDFYTKDKYNEIFDNSKTKNMLVLISLKKFTDFTDYNYIFILKYSDHKELYRIYESYPYLKKFLKFEEFIHLVNTCTENEYSVLIFSCKARTLSDLFYVM